MNTAPDSSKLTPVHARRGMRDWVELMAKDHGVLRLWWHNLHQIDKICGAATSQPHDGLNTQPNWAFGRL